MRILITAGPTYEAIDPVRFIGNHSTGKMGAALAEVAAKAGATVDLVMGPSNIRTENEAIMRIDVTSAQQMYDACMDRFDGCDVAILSAAVADFRPKNIAPQKIKKSQSGLTIELEPTPDILASLGKMKTSQFVVGFALETDNAVTNATEKMMRKNADMIVLNSLQDAGAGFGHDTNRVSIIDRTGRVLTFGLKPKHDVATDILAAIAERIEHK
jgi:phosphopantothenoylcysteine decarboxylase/phosphopantothenate--cysteine ligase